MIDAHAHLSDPRLLDQAPALVRELQMLGLTHIVLGGVAPQEWEQQLALQKSYPQFITTAFGIHPWTIKQNDPESLESMFATLEAQISKASAIGETGLDFFDATTSDERDAQRQWCERHLELAKTHKMPVILHCVRAHNELLSILKKFPRTSGLIHSFAADETIGKQYLKKNFLLSLGPRSIRTKSPGDYRWLPRESFCIESDFPDLPDKNKNSAKDWMAALNEVAKFLATTFSCTIPEIWAQSDVNVRKLFISY